MNIFIGSSQESKDDAKKIAFIIESAGHVSVPWYEPGVFKLNRYTLESLEELLSKIDAAIFVFNEDDKIWYRNDTVSTVRDNVLIEYGLFTGALSRSNVCFCCKGNPHIASDLKGITYINFETPRRAEVEIEEWVKGLSVILRENKKIGFRTESFFDAITYAQRKSDIEILRVFAISSSRFVPMLRANPNLHIKEADVLLRSFRRNEKYIDIEIKKLIDMSLISWKRLKDGGNIDVLNIYNFDYHPNSGYYIFDDQLLIIGNLYYDLSNQHYEFDNTVLMIDDSTSYGKQAIKLFIKKFEKEKKNYEDQL